MIKREDPYYFQRVKLPEGTNIEDESVFIATDDDSPASEGWQRVTLTPATLEWQGDN